MSSDESEARNSFEAVVFKQPDQMGNEKQENKAKFLQLQEKKQQRIYLYEDITKKIVINLCECAFE